MTAHSAEDLLPFCNHLQIAKDKVKKEKQSLNGINAEMPRMAVAELSTTMIFFPKLFSLATAVSLKFKCHSVFHKQENKT